LLRRVGVSKLDNTSVNFYNITNTKNEQYNKIRRE
jgi:hypothetical protein